MMEFFKQALRSSQVLAMFPRERRVPYWSAGRIAELRDRRVRATIRHAAASVPYYQRLFAQLKLDPRDIRGADDLRLLPVVDKHQLRAHPRDFLSTAAGAQDAVRFTTSGTTGEPVEIWHDTRSVLEDVARKERERTPIRALQGVPYLYRTCSLRNSLSSVVTGRTYIQSRMVFPLLGLWMEAPEQQDAAQTLRLINRFRPHVIAGHGMRIDAFFREVAAAGWELARPRVVIYTAEQMTPEGRELIERGFGIPVWTLYNAIESFRIGFSCETSAGIHLHDDLCHLRILRPDGSDAEPEENGEVVITNLVNRATVLINYRLGDVASLSARRCSCGRGFRMLASLDGRTDDVIRLPSGRTLPPRFVASFFKRFTGLRQYQFVQNGWREFEIQIIPAASADAAALEARMAAELSVLLGPDAQVKVLRRHEIQQPPGKRRYIISRLGWSGVGGGVAQRLA